MNWPASAESKGGEGLRIGENFFSPVMRQRVLCIYKSILKFGCLNPCMLVEKVLGGVAIVVASREAVVTYDIKYALRFPTSRNTHAPFLSCNAENRG